MSNYNGHCVSTHGKVSKTGEPKHSGNFSYMTMHNQSLQFHDYPVRKKDGKLIVGDHTPLYELMPMAVYELALTDKYFSTYAREGTMNVGGREYECEKILYKRHYYCAYDLNPYAFVYREKVYTDFDFEYQFKEY